MAYSASSGSSIGRLIRSAGLTLLSVGLAFICTLLLQPSFPYPFLFLFFGAVMARAHGSQAPRPAYLPFYFRPW